MTSKSILKLLSLILAYSVITFGCGRQDQNQLTKESVLMEAPDLHDQNKECIGIQKSIFNVLIQESCKTVQKNWYYQAYIQFFDTFRNGRAQLYGYKQIINALPSGTTMTYAYETLLEQTEQNLLAAKAMNDRFFSKAEGLKGIICYDGYSLELSKLASFKEYQRIEQDRFLHESTPRDDKKYYELLKKAGQALDADKELLIANNLRPCLATTRK